MTTPESLHIDNNFPTTCTTCNEPYINIGHPIWEGAIMQRICACVVESDSTSSANASCTILTMRAPTDEERAAFRLRWADAINFAEKARAERAAVVSAK